MKIYLGGTVNNSHWRKRFMEKMYLVKPETEYYDPVVDLNVKELTTEVDLVLRDACDIKLYMITPRNKGNKIISEIMLSAIKNQNRCIMCFDPTPDDDVWISESTIEGWNSIAKDVESAGGYITKNIEETIEYINSIEN